MYKGEDNIYWTFSSSAQAIAALIGFLAAGFFFIHERMDKEAEKDGTLIEIYTEIKKQYYSRLKNLLTLTGLSITSSLILVYLNGFDLGCWSTLLVVVVGILNIITIVRAMLFVMFIIDPSKVAKAADKLIEEDNESFDSTNSNTISIGSFLEKFVALEKIARDLLDQNQIIGRQGNIAPSFINFQQVIRTLYQIGKITRDQYDKFMYVTRIRNAASHGQISQISPNAGLVVDELINELYKNGK